MKKIKVYKENRRIKYSDRDSSGRELFIEAAESNKKGKTKAAKSNKKDKTTAQISDRDYNYDELIKKNPIKIVDFQVQTVPTKGKKVHQTAMLAPARQGADTLQEGSITQRYAYNADLGKNILITRDGIVHGITGNYKNSSTMNTAEVTFVLPEILRNSVVVNELVPRPGDNATASYVLFGYARRSDGNEYIVRSTVYEREDNMAAVESVEIFDILKGIKAKKIRSLNTGS